MRLVISLGPFVEDLGFLFNGEEEQAKMRLRKEGLPFFLTPQSIFYFVIKLQESP
jgi:hypothetical protein